MGEIKSIEEGLTSLCKERAWSSETRVAGSKEDGREGRLDELGESEEKEEGCLSLGSKKKKKKSQTTRSFRVPRWLLQEGGLLTKRGEKRRGREGRKVLKVNSVRSTSRELSIFGMCKSSRVFFQYLGFKVRWAC